MVVVAIVGILASIALPQYQKYQARARQTEAKLALAAAYTSEQGFLAENGTYTACLKKIGSTLDSATRRYYAAGFYAQAASAPGCGPLGMDLCQTYLYSGATGFAICPASDFAHGATAKMNGSTTLIDFTEFSTHAGATAPCEISQSSFKISAMGNVSTDPLIDIWTIDHNKTLFNSTPGL
jgi:type IV pilus assembly protein PilA